MTIKQKLAAKKITENHGNVSKTMLEVGYSPNTAKKPSNLTESKAWQELMNEKLPDDKLLNVHLDALEATKTSNAAILLTKDGQTVKAEEQGLIEIPDHAVRLKAVELGYKIKHRTDTGVAIQINNIISEKKKSYDI